MLEVTYYQPKRIWGCILVCALFVTASVVHGYSGTPPQVMTAQHPAHASR